MKYGIEISADVSKATKELKKVAGELDGVSKKAVSTKSSVKTFGDDLEKSAKKAGGSVGYLNRGFKELGATIGSKLGIVSLIASFVLFTKRILGAGSALQELDSKARVVFGDTFSTVSQRVDEIAQTVGRSNTAILQFSADMGAVVQATGIAGQSLGEMSTELAQLSVDLASFHNTADIEAFNALRSAITGELEPLKRFGVVMTQANLQAFLLDRGINQNIDTFNQAQLTAIRYNFILDKTKNAQGDAERTASSFANQTRRLTGNLTELFEALSKTGIIYAFGGALYAINSGVENITKTIIGLTNATKTALTFLAQASGFTVGIKDYSTGKGAEQSKIAGLDVNTVGAGNLKDVANRVAAERDRINAEESNRLKEQLQQFSGLGSTGKSGGGAKKETEDVLKTEKERLKVLLESYEQRQKLVGLTKEEQRIYERLKKTVEGAFDARNAKTLSDVVAAINEGGRSLEDVFDDVADKVKSLNKELEDVQEQSEENIARLEEQRQKLLDSFDEDKIDRMKTKAQDLAKAYFEARKTIGGNVLGSNFVATEVGNVDAINTAQGIEEILGKGDDLSALVQKELQLLVDLNNAKGEAARVAIQEAFDNESILADQEKKVAAIDDEIAAEKKKFEEKKLQITTELELQQDVQTKIQNAYRTTAEISKAAINSQIDDLARLKNQAIDALSVISSLTTASALAPKGAITNNTKNTTVNVNNYGEAAKMNADPSILNWKASHY